MGLATWTVKRKLKGRLRPDETVIDYMPRCKALDPRAHGAPMTLVLTTQALYMLHDLDRMNSGGRLPLELIENVTEVGGMLMFEAGSSAHGFGTTSPNGSWMGFGEKLSKWVELAGDPGEDTDLPEVW